MVLFPNKARLWGSLLTLKNWSPERAGRVPRRKLRVAGCGLRGFRKVPLRIPFRLPLRFPEGSAKVPRKLREGSARLLKGSAKFLKAFPCF